MSTTRLLVSPKKLIHRKSVSYVESNHRPYRPLVYIRKACSTYPLTEDSSAEVAFSSFPFEAGVAAKTSWTLGYLRFRGVRNNRFVIPADLNPKGIGEVRLIFDNWLAHSFAPLVAYFWAWKKGG